MKGKWRVVIGLLLSAAVIAYIFSKVDTAKVWAAITQANIPLLLVAVLAATLCFPLRAIRWRIILQPVDPSLSLDLCWRATAVGFALNNVLPLRMGEVARAYSLSREAQKVSFPSAFASLAVDRVFDAVVLISLLFIGLLGLPAARNADDMAKVYAGLVGAALITGTLIVGLIALAFLPERIIAMYRFFTRRISATLEVRGSALLGSIAAGLSVLRSPTRFAAVLLWTIAHWLLNAAAFWIGFQAFGLEASYFAALFTQTAIAIAITAPSTPGYIGIFQWSGQMALGLFGVDPDSAVAWAVAYWAFSFVPITTIGMIYFARMGLSLKELKDVVKGIKGGSK